MKPRTSVLTLAAMLITTVSAVEPTHADDTQQAMATRSGSNPHHETASDAPGEPPAMSTAVRTRKLSSALKALGSNQAPPSALEIRLTPTGPRLQSGARIVEAGVGVFRGGDTKEPGGSFTMMRPAGMPISKIEMRVPTDEGKFYLVDCRVKAAPGTNTIFTLTRGTTHSVLPVEGGHVVTAFSATASETPIVLGAMPSPTDKGVVLGYFYGCDFGKAS